MGDCKWWHPVLSVLIAFIMAGMVCWFGFQWATESASKEVDSWSIIDENTFDEESLKIYLELVDAVNKNIKERGEGE